MNKVVKKLFSKKIWRPIGVTFLSLGTVFSIGLAVVTENESTINSALGTTSSKVVGGDDGAEYTYYESAYSKYSDLSADFRQTCQDVEAEGLVLLKNENNALPLASGDKVSCLLQNSVNLNYGSSGSGKIDSTKYSDLKTALEGEGLSVNETLWNFYKTDSNATSTAYTQRQVKNIDKTYTYKINTLPWSKYSDDAKNSITTTGGTALFVIGRLGGEGSDVDATNSDGVDGSYLSLSREETEILEEMTKLKKSGKIKNIVVLLNSAAAFRTDFLDDADGSIDVDACMWIGNVGITGANAVAQALTGKVNPSGRLVDTYVKDNFASPAMVTWVNTANGHFSQAYSGDTSGLNTNQLYYGVYAEGIYVGYRYFETRYEDVVLGTSNVGSYDYDSVVSRPFGYGLSYTTFSYSDYTVTKNSEGNYDISVTVSNTGDVAGKEVVQIYLQKPYTSYDVANGVEKASVELVGFAKTSSLAADASETVKITVDAEEFKTYDSNGYKTYILEAGDYYLAAGSNAHDALNNILAAKGKTTADGMDANGNSALTQKIDDIALDTDTYSKTTDSKGETVTITNQLDFADINKYENRGDNSVTYVSRSNWSGTFPTGAITLTVNDKMKADMATNIKVESDETYTMPKYGQEAKYSLIQLRSTEEETISYDDERWEELLDQMTFEEQSELVTAGIYGTVGIESVVLPASGAGDGPTGMSNSQDSLSMPSECIWAASFNTELIERVGEMLAEDALSTGRQGMYLPGVNIHRTPFGGRAHEYFAEDPYLSGVAVATEIAGVQSKGVTPYVKHYVFNDEEDNRNGVGIWLNEQSAREIYLKPFEFAVSPEKGNSHGLMSSFNRAGCVWTSASSALMETILRDEFGFDGFVITDMAESNGAGYMSYYDGYMNGTDLWMGNATSLDAYKNDAAFCTKIRESCHRILYVFANYSAVMNGVSPNTRVKSVTPWWKALIITMEAVTFTVGGVAGAMLIGSYVVTAISDKKEREQGSVAEESKKVSA